jgi:hypothetical protein
VHWDGRLAADVAQPARLDGTEIRHVGAARNSRRRPPDEICRQSSLRRCGHKAARRIIEIANAVEPVQGRIHIEKVNEPFLFRDGGSPGGKWRRHETRHRAGLASDA